MVFIVILNFAVCPFIVMPYSERFRKYLAMSCLSQYNLLLLYAISLSSGHLWAGKAEGGAHAPKGSGSKGLKEEADWSLNVCGDFDLEKVIAGSSVTPPQPLPPLHSSLIDRLATTTTHRLHCHVIPYRFNPSYLFPASSPFISFFTPLLSLQSHRKLSLSLFLKLSILFLSYSQWWLWKRWILRRRCLLLSNLRRRSCTLLSHGRRGSDRDDPVLRTPLLRKSTWLCVSSCWPVGAPPPGKSHRCRCGQCLLLPRWISLTSVTSATRPSLRTKLSEATRPATGSPPPTTRPPPPTPPLRRGVPRWILAGRPTSAPSATARSPPGRPWAATSVVTTMVAAAASRLQKALFLVTATGTLTWTCRPCRISGRGFALTEGGKVKLGLSKRWRVHCRRRSHGSCFRSAIWILHMSDQYITWSESLSFMSFFFFNLL